MASEPLSDMRSAWWDVRLDNWALWKGGAGQRGLGSATDGTYGGDFTRPPPPLIGEAVDTDRLVVMLSDEHQQALEAWYVWTGTYEERAADLEVHRNTLRNRVRDAKAGLDVLWWRRLGSRPAATDDKSRMLRCAKGV